MAPDPRGLDEQGTAVELGRVGQPGAYDVLRAPASARRAAGARMLGEG